MGARAGRRPAGARLDSLGFLWPTTLSLHAHCAPEEAFDECVAQVEAAVSWGLCPTHVDSHMGALQTHPAFFEVYVEVAARLGLPLRMAGQREPAAAAWAAGCRLRAARRGLAFTDDLALPERAAAGEDARTFLLRTVRELPDGVTEVFLHPAAAGPDLEAMTRHPAERVRDMDLLCDPPLRQAIADAGVELVDYRSLRTRAATG